MVKGEIDIKLRHKDLLAPVRYEPEEVDDYLYDNRFSNVFAILEALDINNKAILLKAQSDGVLKVSNLGGAYEKYEKKSGTATSTETLVSFQNTVRRLEVYPKDYGVFIRTSYDGVNWNSDKIECIANERRVLDLITKSFYISRSELNDVEYEIIGYI